MRNLAGISITMLTLGALLAGCSAYTKRDFVARADAVCASAVRATRALAPPRLTAAPAQQRRALAAYLTRALPIIRSEAHQLHALPRPSQSAAQRRALARYLAAVDRVSARFEALSSAASAGDGAALERAEAALSAIPIDSLASAYGLASCGTPGATIR
jgi:hypothetical protein